MTTGLFSFVWFELYDQLVLMIHYIENFQWRIWGLWMKLTGVNLHEASVVFTILGAYYLWQQTGPV